MHQDSNTTPFANARVTVRTNMFLAASLDGDGVKIPVKIRNMSSEGAHIESPSVPDPGTTVRMVRGNLDVWATVAWALDGRCGLRLLSPVSVSDWLKPPVNRRQERVVQSTKIGADQSSQLNRADPSNRGPIDETVLAELSDDLSRAGQLLDELRRRLAASPTVAEHHRSELRSIDIATQIIGTVSNALR